ncbi:isopentenyl-diphosphate Delta-isomerase [Microbacterium alcoholitolerans]|uniref:isopentenyl-diphosphate Delta-isomerase n=1 Tax=unclassified Microbacterium TaxID=2609290 RepID=UPI003D17B4D7
MEQQVVLLDPDGRRIGVIDKRDVHTRETPLHLAFSCYLLGPTGDVLLTRRALSKRTWPGVWTNSVCGHPAPEESMTDAISRRAREELGVGITDIRAALPDFRYRATDASGIVENEICPVYVARLSGPPQPEAREVAEWSWVSPDALAGALGRTPFVFSPWLQLQLPLLLEKGMLE